MSEVEKVEVEVEERHYDVTLHIGYPSRQEDTLTVRIPVGATKEEEDAIVEKAWQEWIWQFIDGGWKEVEDE